VLSWPRCGLGPMPSRNLVQDRGNVRSQLNAALPMGLVRDRELSATAKAVAVEIWSHTEGRHQSASSVAEALSVNRKTVYSALAELERRGWLVRQSHYAEGKTKPAWERWHRQMTNTPFTKEQTLSLKRTGTCPSDGQVRVPETDTIEVQGRSAREVHSDLSSEGEAVRQADSIPGVVAEKSATPPTHGSSIFDLDPRAATDVVAATPSSLTTSVSSSGGPRWGEDPFASEWDLQDSTAAAVSSNSDLDHCSSTSDLDPGASADADAAPPRLSDEPTGSSGGFRRSLGDAMSLGDEYEWN
jgi:hypothetical protein